MASQKISELTEDTAPIAADLFAIVDTTNSTTKKIQFVTVENAILDQVYIQMGGFI